MQGTAVCPQVFSRQLIVLTGAAAELVGPSVSYLKIRAWSAPAVLITMVAQVSPAAAHKAAHAGISTVTVLATLPLVHQREAASYHQCADFTDRLAHDSTCCPQSGLLAQKDSLTPLIWVVVQTILNIVWDVLLIKVWKGGLPGAAWATLLSQLAGTAGLVWMMGSKGKVSHAPYSAPPTVSSHPGGQKARMYPELTMACKPTAAAVSQGMPFAKLECLS